jgi:hypothetical protein
MASQRTAVITGSASRSAGNISIGAKLRNPFVRNELCCLSKDRAPLRVLFTGSAPSATINHNNLDTCNMSALILGIPGGGFESGILLRARRQWRRSSQGAPTVLACSADTWYPAPVGHTAPKMKFV